MKVADFDFDLPPHLVAQHPVEPRDAARLLVIRPDLLRDGSIAELPRLLRRGDLLVFNDTRVIKARLHGRRGDAAIEATLHQRVDDATWRAFARPAKKLKPGDRIAWAPDFDAEVVEKGEGGEVALRFSCAGPALMAALERHGQMPLPPYIRRAKGGDPHDDADYQTIWARREGAVAAPTAGLHFTPGLLDALDRAGVERVAITLHVGAGTFLPVKVEDTADHVMHAEIAEVTSGATRRINETRARGGRIVAIGTTVVRTLESAADEAGILRPFAGETRLFITPGYRFRTADLLLTNFHLPRSTLFMLAAAFAGLDRIRAAYAHAIRQGYRFYSYGDCCLLHRAGDAA